MGTYRSRGDSHARAYDSRTRGDFYDDRRSRSSSPTARNSSPPRRFQPDDGSRGTEPHGRMNSRSPPRYRERSRGGAGFDEKRRNTPSPRRSRDYNAGRRRSRSRRRHPDSPPERSLSRGRPSKEIMMEGLAPHITENDIATELEQHYNVLNLDDVRVIRDRETKKSREFGFLRFSAIEDAEAFMDANHPYIYLYGNRVTSHSSSDAKVRIAYGKERKEPRTEEGDWVCKVCNINNYATRARCFRCQTFRPEQHSARSNNVGDNDAAPDQKPSQFLLIRGLSSSVSEELLAKGMTKLNKPSHSQTQHSQSLAKKGTKVVSTTGDTNLGAKEGTLRRVLLVRDRQSNESWRYGFAEYASIEDAQAALTRCNSFDRFTIASGQVLVSYIHAGVFVPVLHPTPSTNRLTFSPLGNPSLKLAYWDEEAYVTELVVSLPEAQPKDTKSTPGPADTEGFKSVKDADRMKKRKAADATAQGSKKATPSHLQFWSNRHAELHGIKPKDDSSDLNSGTTPVLPSKSYADPERRCCYLCMRQFTSAAEVNKHERLSNLHRQNLENTAKVQRAEHKLDKHRVPQNMSSAPSSEYRDRARERRKIYGVVNKQGEQVGGPKHSKQSSDGDDENDDDNSARARVPGSASGLPKPQSKGAAILNKMGYTAGQGLGASGEGMTAPISQDIYVAGVGLGAQGGKVGDAVTEAERNTRGDYSAFAERTREGARERYARLGE